jgi:hypothetical protein
MAYGAEARDHKVGRRGGAARKSASRSRTHEPWGVGGGRRAGPGSPRPALGACGGGATARGPSVERDS